MSPGKPVSGGRDKEDARGTLRPPLPFQRIGPCGPPRITPSMQRLRHARCKAGRTIMADHTTSASKGGLSRRTLLAGAAAAISVGGHSHHPARAAEFSYKVATGQSLTQPINARLEQGLRAHPGGLRRPHGAEVLPPSQLGSDTDLITQVRSGGIEFLNIAGSVISTVASGAAITNVGFAFADYDHVWRGVDGGRGHLCARQVEKSWPRVVSKASDNGFRQITSASKPIRVPSDLKGYRIRVPVSPIFTSLFTSLGANPTSINFNELYTALQTRLVDARRTAWSPSIPASSTRCRNTSPRPTTSGSVLADGGTGARSPVCPRTCRRS